MIKPGVVTNSIKQAPLTIVLMCTIVITNYAKKCLRKLSKHNPTTLEKVDEFIETLESNPFASKRLKHVPNCYGKPFENQKMILIWYINTKIVHIIYYGEAHNKGYDFLKRLRQKKQLD